MSVGGDFQLESRALLTCLAWGNDVSPQFRDKVNQIAAHLHTDPNSIMAAIAFETGESFSPSVKNRQSKATGLIQFTPATAKSLGTTTAKLAKMSPEAQLDYVEKYFAKVEKSNGALNSLEDVYAGILYPISVGKPDSYVDFDSHSKSARNRLAYRQNQPLDADGDGKITKAEATARVAAKLAKGNTPAHCYMPPDPTPAQPVLYVGPNVLNFTATEGGPSPAPGGILVANLGGVGSTLDFLTTGSRNVTVRPDKTELASGEFTSCRVSVDTDGLKVGTYDFPFVVESPGAINGTRVLNAHVTIQPKSPPTNSTTYSGSFTGFVQNSDSDSSDPDGAFTDSYGGPATATFTQGATGGFTLNFSADLKSGQPHGESFDASPNGNTTVNDPSNIVFTFTMGDGVCRVTGALVGGTFAGSWVFVQSNSSDTSDSGGGSFSLNILTG